EPEAANLRANIIDYAANAEIAGGPGPQPLPDARPIPVLGLGGAALLLALLVVVAYRGLRSAPRI
ncbi:MAG TPA: hypothetical protein PKZ76_12380, partial [Xanthomonadaceae bacterium]|nr:hypothetical protein [Xanthomonadaceae bacterium]